MPNQITVIQNDPALLAQLAAQRALYSSAKKHFAFQLILSVPVVIIVSLAALAFDKQWWGLERRDLAWLVGLVSVVFLMLDVIVWTPGINRKREKAAQIQQMFDCAVLNMQWDEIAYGRRPDHEEIVIWAKKYSPAYQNCIELHDWYRVEVASPKISAARLICQRINCWWDMSLRETYNLMLYWAATILIVLVGLIALILDVSLTNLFALFFAPLLPFLTLVPKLAQDNRDAISRLNFMKEAIDNTWNKLLTSALSEESLERSSLLLQIGIFNNRKSNPVIFDFLHNVMREQNEGVAKESVEYQVHELSINRPELF
jgi:hypothetical protein